MCALVTEVQAAINLNYTPHYRLQWQRERGDTNAHVDMSGSSYDASRISLLAAVELAEWARQQALYSLIT